MQKKYLFLALILATTLTVSTGLIHAANTTTNQNREQMMQQRQGNPASGTMGMPQGQDQQNCNCQNQQQGQANEQGMQMRSGIIGKIASINGDTITLESNNSYTTIIDASDIDISDYQVGDFISVKGDISVTAEEINEKPTDASGTMNFENQQAPTQTASGTGIWSKIGNFFGKLFSK